MALQEYHGKIPIGATADSFTLNNGSPSNVTLTNGRYYIAGYTGEGTNQLVERMQVDIRAVAGYSAATVTYSRSTGKVSLGFAATTSVTWTDTALRDILGFTADLSGSTSYTATNQPKYVWRPSRAPSDHPVTLSRWWDSDSNSRLVVSPDGTPYSIAGNTAYHALVVYRYLPQAEVIIPATGANKEFERFWLDVVAPGLPVRVYPDYTAYTSSDYVTALMGREDEAIGNFRGMATRSLESYQGLWDVELRMRRYTE